MPTFFDPFALRPQIRADATALSPRTATASTPPVYEGLTLDALMARQKEIAAAAQGIPQMNAGTPMQGMAMMAHSLVNNLQASKARRDEQAARQALAQLMSGIGAGGPTQEQIGQASLIDPDFALRLQERGWTVADEAREREQELADLQSGRTFQTGERVSGQEFTTSERLAKEAADARVRQEQLDAQIAAEKRAEEQAARERTATPDTALGKLKADLDEGRITQEQYDAAVAKENAPPAPLVDMSVKGDSKLREELGKKEAENWQAYLNSADTSGAMTGDMQVLDELIKSAPQGPIAGNLAQHPLLKGFSTSGAAFQSIIKRVAPTLRAPGSGATSDIEYQGMLDSLPSLANYPEANALIIQLMKDKAALNIERGDIVSAYANGDIEAKEARARLTALNRRSIMSNELKALLGGVQDNAPQGQPPAGTGTSPDDDALLEQYLNPQ